MSKEYILSAAVFINDDSIHDEQPINIEKGYVVTGRRHNNCFKTISILNDLNDIANKYKLECGFITNLDRYVNREEAFKIAIESNQILFPSNLDDTLFCRGLEMTNNEIKILMSENLY